MKLGKVKHEKKHGAGNHSVKREIHPLYDVLAEEIIHRHKRTQNQIGEEHTHQEALLA